MTDYARRVLLVAPPNPFLEARSVPRLGLLYLGTILDKAGHAVVIRHLRSLEELQQLVEGSWDVVGISATTREYLDAVQILNYFKRISPRTPIVLGGPHGSALSDEAARNGFDIVVIGEAEEHIVEVIESLPGNRSRLFCEPVQRLDDLPFPNWELLDDPDSWRPSLFCGQPRNMRVAAMILSRGCPYACRFCGPHARYRRRGAENIAAELVLLRRHGFEGLILMDDLPFRQERDVRDFCERIVPLQMPWRANFRPDLFTEQIGELLVAAGCRRVQFGIESTRQTTLDRVGKKTLAERSGLAVSTCRGLGLEVKAMFVWGLPGDDEAAARELVSWVAEYRPDSVQVSMFCPLPGSPLWNAGCGAGVTDYRRLDFFRGSAERGPVGAAEDPTTAQQLGELYDWILAKCDGLVRIDRGLPLEATRTEVEHVHA